MRAKNEFKFIAEAYQNVHNEDTEDIFPNSESGRRLKRDAAEHEQEDKEMREFIEHQQELIAGGYVRLHRKGEHRKEEFQTRAPWDGSNIARLKSQGWKEVPFETIRLTRPGESTVELPPPYTDIHKYLDNGFKVVKDYKKATQSEDDEENEDENLDVTQGDTSADDFTDEVEHTPY